MLTSDGKLIISFRPKHIMKQYPVTQWGFTGYTQAEAEALLQQHGFAISETTLVQEPSHEAWGHVFQRESLMIVGEKA